MNFLYSGQIPVENEKNLIENLVRVFGFAENLKIVGSNPAKGQAHNMFFHQFSVYLSKMDTIIVSREVAYFVAIMLSIFSIVGTVGNLCTIVALWKSKLRKQSTTKFIISLAVCDLLMSSLIFPPMAQQHTRT